MADWPYNLAQWKRLRLLKLSMDPLCELCNEVADQVDHIVAINAGGEPWDMDNLQSLCQSCHSGKTRAEMQGKKFIIKGADPVTGKPKDRRHWWHE